jgi:hypothetical protein
MSDLKVEVLQGGYDCPIIDDMALHRADMSDATTALNPK